MSMIRSKQVKMNAILTIRVIKLLFYNEMTAHDIAEETGLHLVTVSRYVREMHKQKMAHIVGWEKDVKGRDATAVWKFGYGRDKPRAVVSAAERQRTYKQRLAQKEMIQRMAGAISTERLREAA
jgi:hypothetical protein